MSAVEPQISADFLRGERRAGDVITGAKADLSKYASYFFQLIGQSKRVPYLFTRTYAIHTV